MRQPFLFALIVVILGVALYIVYFIETAPQVPLDGRATTTTSTATSSTSTSSPSDQQTPSEHTPIVAIGGTRVAVAVADTPEKRAQGLSGRTSLTDGTGMLFVFPEVGLHGFWMKDMQFSIDIIWLSEDGAVVHMAEDVPPESYPASFRPEEPALYVLEVPAGFVKAHHIATGSKALIEW